MGRSPPRGWHNVTARSARALTLLALAALAAPLEAGAVAYDFSTIADTATLPAYFHLRGGDISDQGSVTFLGTGGTATGSRETLFFYRDGQLHTLADTADPRYRRIWNVGATNGHDHVAFSAEVAGVGEAVLVHDGTAARQLYPSASAPLTYLREPPSLNDAGQVAFRSFSPGSSSTSGVYVGDGVTTRTVDERSSPSAGVTVPDLNNAGQVAYRVRAGTDRIFLDTNGTKTLVAESGAGPFRAGLDDPAVNDNGRVAFVGYDVFEGQGVRGVYVGSGGAVSTVADSSGPLGTFGPFIGINNRDEVAFLAWLDGGDLESGGSGIYTGPDVVADKVIAAGDPLAGSRVESLYYYGGINGTGQITFEYRLENGTQGIAVATPVPEPMGAAAAAAASLLLFLRRPQRSPFPPLPSPNESVRGRGTRIPRSRLGVLRPVRLIHRAETRHLPRIVDRAGADRVELAARDLRQRITPAPVPPRQSAALHGHGVRRDMNPPRRVISTLHRVHRNRIAETSGPSPRNPSH